MKIAFPLPLLIATVVSVTTAGVPVAPNASAETLAAGTFNSLAQEASQPAGETANIAGKWLLSWQGKKRSRRATLEIQQDGSKLTGTVGAQEGSESLEGSLQGNQVSMSFGGKKRSRTFTGTLAGNKMSGTTNDGSSWTATRQ